MKKPLTNNIYCVTLKKVANIYVDADSPEEAMKIANRWTDSVDDDEFEDSEVEVDCCDSYPDEATDSYMETIYTQDEALGSMSILNGMSLRIRRKLLAVAGT